MGSTRNMLLLLVAGSLCAVQASGFQHGDKVYVTRDDLGQPLREARLAKVMRRIAANVYWITTMGPSGKYNGAYKCSGTALKRRDMNDEKMISETRPEDWTPQKSAAPTAPLVLPREQTEEKHDELGAQI